ncbi:MAG TPA: hypothetical protein VJB11_01905, partial [archaeon]|nr:hypothetical protein [archaeon]
FKKISMIPDKKIIKNWAKDVKVIKGFGDDGKKYIAFTCASHGCCNIIEEYEIKHKVKDGDNTKGKIRCCLCKTYNTISY